MLILGIETATDVCSVGIVDGERDVASFSLLKPRQHGTRLAGLISSALEAAGAAPEDLDGIAVSAGPGSYTGLRIGVSIAKGLCLASGASLLSVSTLEALATASGESADGETRLATLPSRRGEIYAAAYRYESARWAEVRAPEALALSDLSAWCNGLESVHLVGSGAASASGALSEADVAHRVVTGSPSGLTVARLGCQRLASGEVEDVAAYEPAYLKPFISGGA